MCNPVAMVGGGMLLGRLFDGSPSMPNLPSPPQAPKTPSWANFAGQRRFNRRPATLLTGAQGIDPNRLNLGQNTLLGQ